VPPILGGEYVLENLEPTDIAVHFVLTGQIDQKTRHVPTGTPIKSVEIAD